MNPSDGSLSCDSTPVAKRCDQAKVASQARRASAYHPSLSTLAGVPAPMLPPDLQAERERRARAARKALANDVRQAAINATPAELEDLKRLTDACQAGTVTADQAHRDVAFMRDNQRNRRSTPASLTTFKDRQRARLREAVNQVWHRHHGRYQHEIEALLALVDDEQMTVRDAHERLVDLEQRTRSLAA